MFPPKGPNPYGQQPPYGGQQSYGGQIVCPLIWYLCPSYCFQIYGRFLTMSVRKTLRSFVCVQPGSSGFGASAAAGARGAGQGAAGQYGGPYASVYGTQQVVK
jgi:hypothetical protein